MPGGSWVIIGPSTLFRGTILSEKNYVYKPTCVTQTSTPTSSPTSSTPTDPQVPIKPIGFVATGGGSPIKFRAAPAPVLLARSVPTSILISAIGVKAKIVSLGFDSEGGMEVPTSGAVTGWFNGAPTPGRLSIP